MLPIRVDGSVVNPISPRQTHTPSVHRGITLMIAVGILTLSSAASRAQPSGPVAQHRHQHAHGMHGMDHWTAPSKARHRRNPVKASAASIRRGRALFQQYCVDCHGQSGAGDGPLALGLEPMPANLREMSSLHNDGDLAWKIAEGRGPMPAWKGRFKARDIWNLVNYLKRMSRD